MTDRIWEILRFCLVGALTFFLDYGLLYILTEYVGFYFLVSSAISFIVAVAFNYWLCLVFVFQNSIKQDTKQATIFIGSSILGLALNQVCMWFMVDILHIYYMLSKIGATFIVTVWNYIAKRYAIEGFS